MKIISFFRNETLNSAVVRLEECYWESKPNSRKQVRAILDKIIESEDLKLKRLHIGKFYRFIENSISFSRPSSTIMPTVRTSH